jgi:hypothetical protein
VTDDAKKQLDCLIRYYDSDYGSDGMSVSPHKFAITKTTPCGFWIGLGWEKKRFVLSSGRKRFAYPTREEALESFIARKKRQIMLVEYRLERSKGALAVAQEMKERGLESLHRGVDSTFLIFDRRSE